MERGGREGWREEEKDGGRRERRMEGGGERWREEGEKDGGEGGGREGWREEGENGGREWMEMVNSALFTRGLLLLVICLTGGYSDTVQGVR